MFRIIKLEQKNFHIMMFVILQISYIALITEWIITYNYGYPNENLMIYVCAFIWELTMLIAHSIFVIKYYIISLKIAELLNNKEDKYITKKDWTVIIV